MGFVFDWISIFARLAAHAAMTKLSLPHTKAAAGSAARQSASVRILWRCFGFIGISFVEKYFASTKQHGRFCVALFAWLR